MNTFAFRSIELPPSINYCCDIFSNQLYSSLIQTKISLKYIREK